ncbi:hypothetical protein R5R35_010937 [Gryllus longicercus]|uniref:Uncharacterized protein n=1 Tax=Gryllus longicercus TaxID=2509291 RepID=A0AAN9VBQ5_9ORTH
MGRVLKKKHRSKGEKLVIRHKKSEIFPGHNTILPKDQKKLLTNARLTVPHVQTGIFMKGRKSSTYCREDVRFNMMNRARMNEKLNDILSLAKHSHGSSHKSINESIDTVHDVQTHIFSQEREHHVNSSQSMILEEQCGKKKYQLSQSLPKGISTPGEMENQAKRNIFQCQKLQSSEENFHESEYSNFKFFITHFDCVSFNLVFTEDFIVQEKLALKKKKQNKLMDHTSFNKLSKINKEKRTTIRHSQYPEGEDLMDKTEMLKNINCRNINKTVKLPKKNLNYNAFKNVKKIQIINTSHGQRKNHEYLENMDIFPGHSLSLSPHHKFELHTTEMTFSSKDKITFSEESRCKTKQSLLNPLRFLENSLSENNKNLIPSKSSSLDGFQFLKHSLGLSSSSAPPDMHVPIHRHMKQLSRFPTSLCENLTKEINEKFESHTINQHSPSSVNIWKNDLKFSLSESPCNHEIFDLQFDEQMDTRPDDFQIGNYFTDEKVVSKNLKDCEDCMSCGSVIQSQTFENRSPSLRNINYSSSPINIEKVTKPLKLESPILKTTVKRQDIKKPCCLHFPDDNYQSQTTKNDVLSLSNFEEEDFRANNFWHRRKMF